MRRDEALEILGPHAEELKSSFGIRSLSRFGSVARDQAGPESDVDLRVEFDRPVGLFGSVPPGNWRLRVDDILECIAAVEEYTEGMELDSFRQSIVT